MRMINQAGLELIKEFEGLRLTAYQCSANKWTLGYGHTKGVKEGQTISLAQANAYLLDDIQDAQKAVSDLVKVTLTENEYAALVSFVFNLGRGSFEKSTMLKLLNRGMYDTVPPQLMRWTKVNGEDVAGLKRRRAAEAKLWNTR